MHQTPNSKVTPRQRTNDNETNGQNPNQWTPRPIQGTAARRPGKGRRQLAPSECDRSAGGVDAG
eukprot:5240725-Amphidinium_carterae.1